MLRFYLRKPSLFVRKSEIYISFFDTHV
jgi:hypothetical protein